MKVIFSFSRRSLRLSHGPTSDLSQFTMNNKYKKNRTENNRLDFIFAEFVFFYGFVCAIFYSLCI